MDILEDITDVELPISRACDALSVSRATLYRQTSLSPPPTFTERAPSPRRLSDDERNTILDLLHSPRFADQPPPEVYAARLTEGVYLASIRTMYRLLAEAGESQERRAQRAPIVHAKPSLVANAPNQVWTWDITKLRGPLPGVFYFLYVVIDLFSRYVTGWLLAEKESAAHAERLFADTIARHGIAPGALIVHADRGAPMKSKDLADLFALLGVARSFSRPHVSDDNAFSEAQFKTLKYQPDYPSHFGSPVHARGYAQEFFGWHNDEHHHASLALFTPADVFFERVDEVAARRQRALDLACAAHPERFPNGPPRVARPPKSVCINPIIAVDDTDVTERGSATRAPPRSAALANVNPS